MNYVEMNTVIGSPGGKLIMTFQFVNMDFMFGLLIDNKSAAEAANKILLLKETFNCSAVKFADVFPVLLTDNGGEFSDVYSFEKVNSQRKIQGEFSMETTMEIHVFLVISNSTS